MGAAICTTEDPIMTASLVRVFALSTALTALVGLGVQPAHAQANQQAAITRFEFDGALDATFGGDGHVVTNVANSSDEAFASGALTTVMTMDDRIIAAGGRISSAGVPQMLLARYFTSNGNLDTAFGTSGLVALDITGFGSKIFLKVAIDSSRRIVAMGRMVQTPSDGRVTVFGSVLP
jgi:uncharacterized delta-60 repeat protein